MMSKDVHPKQLTLRPTKHKRERESVILFLHVG